MKKQLRTDDPRIAIDIVKDSLDFSDIQRLLVAISDQEQQNDLSDQIDNAVNAHIEAGFYLGWEVRRDPTSFIFQDGNARNGLNSADPQYLFWQAMRDMNIDDADSALDQNIVADLLAAAAEGGFALGWAAQSDPEFLIFGSKAK